MPKYFEELKLGYKFEGVSITVTEAHIVFYGSLAGDLYPWHMNEEYAKKYSPARTRIAHGMLTATLIVPGMSRLDAESVSHLGEHFTFRDPVCIGDTISSEWEVARLEPKKNWGLVGLRSVVKNQKGRIVLEGESVIAVAYRPKNPGQT